MPGLRRPEAAVRRPDCSASGGETRPAVPMPRARARSGDRLARSRRRRTPLCPRHRGPASPPTRSARTMESCSVALPSRTGRAVLPRACFLDPGKVRGGGLVRNEDQLCIGPARGRSRQTPGGERPRLRRQVEPATRVGAPPPSRSNGSSGATPFTRATTLSKRGSPRTWIRREQRPAAPAGTHAGRDRRGYGDGAGTPGPSSWPGEPAKTTAARLTVARDESYIGPAAGCAGRRAPARHRAWRRPAGPAEASCKQAIHVFGQIIGKVVRDIGGDSPSPAPRQRGLKWVYTIWHSGRSGGAAQTHSPPAGPLPPRPHETRPVAGSGPGAIGTSPAAVHPQPIGPAVRSGSADAEGPMQEPPPGRDEWLLDRPPRWTAWRNVAGLHSKRKRLAARPQMLLQLLPQYHVPPATEEVIHCLQSQGSPAAVS